MSIVPDPNWFPWIMARVPLFQWHIHNQRGTLCMWQKCHYQLHQFSYLRIVFPNLWVFIIFSSLKYFLVIAGEGSQKCCWLLYQVYESKGTRTITLQCNCISIKIMKYNLGSGILCVVACCAHISF